MAGQRGLLSRFSSAALLALSAGWVVGCTDNAVVRQQPSTESNRSTAGPLVKDYSATDTLARGIALALGEPRLRAQLHDDLRDAPTLRHAIHLTSYLRGRHGRMLADEIAIRLALPIDSLFALVQRLPPLELLMERSVDRLNWTGTSDVVVFGTLLPWDSLAKLTPTRVGFSTSGEPVTVDLLAFSRFPTLALRRVQTAFGTDPELQRAQAPHQPRSVIASREEEIELLAVTSAPPGLSPTKAPLRSIQPCDGIPQNQCDSGGPGGTVDTYGVKVDSTSWVYCSMNVPAADDADLDKFRDSCEERLARAFAPRLITSSGDPNTVREPRWSVTRRVPVWPDVANVKIFYAISYLQDAGSPLAFWQTGHDGDSEFIIVEIHNTNNTGGNWWAVDHVTLSAHWGESSGGADHTARYNYDVMEWDVQYRGRPRVWVSTGKHANYVTRSQCIGYYNDACGYEYYYSVTALAHYADANLGDYFNPDTPGAVPINPYVLNRYPGLAGTSPSQGENYWNASATPGNFFGGWYTRNGQPMAGGYGFSLSAFKF